MELDENDDSSVRRKGRGFRQTTAADAAERTELIDRQAKYDRLEDTRESAAGKAARSVEGWIVFVTGVHEEATEEDLQDKFSDFGDIKNLHLNLDRRTGYVKGYALVEYETRGEAQKAIQGADGTQLLEQTVHCDFAFVKPPAGASKSAAPANGNSRRSQSPQPLRNRID